MASPRERDHRTPMIAHPRPQLTRARRHHFHESPPWPHQRYGDYVNVDRWGWWPRWFPYWDQSWFTYWWYLYDYYGGDANPEYAEFKRDAVLRQNAPTWGLVIGADPVVRDHRGSGMAVRDHRDPGRMPVQFGMPSAAHHPVVSPGTQFGMPSAAHHPIHPGWDHEGGSHRQRYPHPHDHYRDYTVIEGAWWPRWFPYWDRAWRSYWAQLYLYYGGDALADYAQYARDAHLRADARRLGWM